MAGELDRASCEDEEPAFTQHFKNVAAFAVLLIEHLAAGSPDLLPSHLALSVNYPPLSPSEIQGVSVNRLGVASTRQLIYVEIAPGLFFPDSVPATAEPEVPFSDRESYNAGFITIVPLDGDYTARFN